MTMQTTAACSVRRSSATGALRSTTTAPSSRSASGGSASLTLLTHAKWYDLRSQVEFDLVRGS